MTSLRTKSLEENLPKENFMLVHRTFIVNLDKATVIERQHIIFDKNVYIPIGKQYKEVFECYIQQYFLDMKISRKNNRTFLFFKRF